MSRGTLVLSVRFRPPVRGCYPLWLRFPTVFSSTSGSLRQPATPRVRRLAVWPPPFSLATTMGIDFSFFSSRYLDVSVPGVPSCKTMYSSYGDSGSHCRVSPFGDPWIYARFQLPMAFRRSLRPSSATGAKASSLCSCSLEQALYRSLPFGFFRYNLTYHQAFVDKPDAP